jgi:hypothetical protein
MGNHVVFRYTNENPTLAPLNLLVALSFAKQAKTVISHRSPVFPTQ